MAPHRKKKKKKSNINGFCGSPDVGLTREDYRSAILNMFEEALLI